MTNFQDFVDNAATQVKTVWASTKTAAIVIFVAGLLTGCVLF